jgi:hypothetical protein
VSAHGQNVPKLGGRTWGVALVVIGLLLFSWPFVRTPPLGLLGSYLHLLGSWAVIVAAIAVTARALGRRTPDA